MLGLHSAWNGRPLVDRLKPNTLRSSKTSILDILTPERYDGKLARTEKPLTKYKTCNSSNKLSETSGGNWSLYF